MARTLQRWSIECRTFCCLAANLALSIVHSLVNYNLAFDCAPNLLIRQLLDWNWVSIVPQDRLFTTHELDCCHFALLRAGLMLSNWVASVLDSDKEGPGFKLQPRRCWVSLRQTVHTHRASVHQTAKLVAALLRVARVTSGLAESNGSYCQVYDSRHVQADCQEPGSAPKPYARQSSMGYLFKYYCVYYYTICLQCFDAVGWASWRASGL